jgi:protein gp37
MTKIEWKEENWNPVRGCSLIPEKLTEPLHWRKPRRVFINSMSDLFHESLSDEAIDQVFAVMALCPQHIFQVLTKRAKRMREYWRNPAELRDRWFSALLDPRIFPSDPRRAVLGMPSRAAVAEGIGKGWRKIMLPNVHLGVSVESQRYAEERIPGLLATPAAVRWVSAEPLLEAVQLRRPWVDYLEGWTTPPADECGGLQIETNRIDWVVCGGESGPGARPFDLAWARSIIAQCRAAGVPVFFKQAGANVIDSAIDAGVHGSRHRKAFFSHKGGDPAEWPADLRVREYPR